MSSKWEEIAAGDGQMRCYVAAPEGTGPFPTVIVIQHAGGVDEFVRSMTDKFGAEGLPRRRTRSLSSRRSEHQR